MAKRLRYLIGLCCSFIILGLMLCSCNKAKEADSGDSKEEVSTPAAAPPAVVAMTVKKEDVPVYSDWVGQTDASQTVNIRARANGELEKTSFKEGDYVEQGQVLFQIDQDNYKAALQAAKAELEKAQAELSQAMQQVTTKAEKATQAKYDSALTRAELDLTRVKALAAQGALSQHDLDVAVDAAKQARAQVEAQHAVVSDTDLNKTSTIETSRANVEAAKAKVKQAELDLGFTTIRSPLRGIIGKILVYPGNLVSKLENTTLATISAVDPIKVNFSVSEAEYLKVAKKFAVTGKTADSPLELTLADNTVYPFKGKFKLVDRAVDSKTGTIGVQAEFPNAKAILRPGEFARVHALVDTQKNAILIPDKCVQDLQGSKTVYVVGPENKIQLRPVSVGTKFKDKVIIDSGLSAGDKVVVEGLQKCVPGQPVSLASKDIQ